jgi:hypothetical protein
LNSKQLIKLENTKTLNYKQNVIISARLCNNAPISILIAQEEEEKMCACI